MSNTTDGGAGKEAVHLRATDTTGGITLSTAGTTGRVDFLASGLNGLVSARATGTNGAVEVQAGVSGRFAVSVGLNKALVVNTVGRCKA